MKMPRQKAEKTPSQKKVTIFCEAEEEEDPEIEGKNLEQQLLPPPPSVRKGKKNITFDRIEDIDEDLSGLGNEASSNSRSINVGGHTILILDERLQGLPWESMPCLQSRQCSRVPSLALLLATSYDLFMSPQAKNDIRIFLKERRRAEIEHLHGSDGQKEDQENQGAYDENAFTPPRSVTTKTSTPCISPLRSPTRKSKTPAKTPVTTGTSWKKFLDSCVSISRSWYVIDPECNLPHTRATMSAFLKPFAKQYDWPGVVAAIPPEATVKVRHNESQLFIFCGHGAGEKICDTQLLKKFIALLPCFGVAPVGALPHKGYTTLLVLHYNT